VLIIFLISNLVILQNASITFCDLLSVRLGYVTAEDFDAWVKPEEMVGSLK
jgi:fumarate hydratase class II